MAIEVVMPRFGWTMEEGILAEWVKQDGDTVQPGDIIFTVESDKALQEVEAFDGGILRIPPDSPPPGSTVRVGGLLAYLVQPGETPPFETGGGGASAVTPAATPTTERALQPATAARQPVPRANGDTPAISPRARRVAAELGVDWTALRGSGRTGRIIERDVRAALQTTVAQPAPAAVEITPVARRAAAGLGVDLATLAEQYPGRRITREDVERAAAQTAPAAAAPIGGARQPMSRVRRLTADAMSRSVRTVAAVTLTTEVDTTELVNLRQQLKTAGREPVPSYNDLLIKLAAAALAEHPALNARLDGDDIVQPDAIHIGLAVDSPRGLLVPVVRDADRKSLRQIAQESAALIAATRAGTVTAEALTGGTFTITNLGMYDIDAFTPIINLPECAILGVGRIVPKQVVTDAEAGRLAIRQMMFLSLTFDHRLVDGAPAARFMQLVRRFVEQPYLWLAG